MYVSSGEIMGLIVQHCRQPPFGATAIYVNIGLLFVCGVAAGFNHGRHFAATVHAFHLTCMAVFIYASDALQYRHAVKVMLCKMCIISGLNELHQSVVCK